MKTTPKVSKVSMADSAITLRSGRQVYPYCGQSVWVRRIEAGDDDGDGLAHAKAILAAAVVRHDLRDPKTGAPWPQWYGDPKAVTASRIPAETLPDLVCACLYGEIPEARGKGFMRGRVGTNTRRCSAKTTPSCASGHRRLRSGAC